MSSNAPNCASAKITRLSGWWGRILVGDDDDEGEVARKAAGSPMRLRTTKLRLFVLSTAAATDVDDDEESDDAFRSKERRKAVRLRLYRILRSLKVIRIGVVDRIGSQPPGRC